MHVFAVLALLSVAVSAQAVGVTDCSTRPHNLLSLDASAATAQQWPHGESVVVEGLVHSVESRSELTRINLRVSIFFNHHHES